MTTGQRFRFGCKPKTWCVLAALSILVILGLFFLKGKTKSPVVLQSSDRFWESLQTYLENHPALESEMEGNRVLTFVAEAVRGGPESLAERNEKTPMVTQENFQEVVKFAVLGDLHLDGSQERTDGFQEALQHLQQQPVDFIIVIGDLTQEGQAQEYEKLKALLQASGVTYFVVSGNHDVGLEAEPEGRKNFEAMFGPSYREVVIPLDRGRDITQIRLFLLDTAQWRSGGLTTLGDTQWQWLQERFEKLKPNSKELRFVVSQTPFDRLSLTDSHYLRQWVCAARVDGFFEADAHETEFFFRSCPVPLDQDNVDPLALSFPTFKVGALFKPVREFPGFLVVRYYNNHFFEMERVVLRQTAFQFPSASYGTN